MRKRISLQSEGIIAGVWRFSGFLLIQFSHLNCSFPFESDQGSFMSSIGGSSDSCEQKLLPILTVVFIS